MQDFLKIISKPSNPLPKRELKDAFAFGILSLRNIENHLFKTGKKSKFIVQNKVEIILCLLSFPTTIYYFIYILAGAPKGISVLFCDF